MKYLVTGASKGIGKAIAEQLLKNGHVVVGLARFIDAPVGHENFIAEKIDLNCLKTLPQNLKNLAKKHSDLDGLILNAGRGHFGNLEQLSYEQINSLIALNLLSPIYTTRAFLPAMKKRGKGDLLFIGSESALQGKKRGSIYCASKFGLRGFVQAIREESAADHIRVTLINPGMVDTPFFDTLSFEPGKNPQEHLVAEDIADTVSLVLSSREGAVFDEINLSPQKKTILKTNG